MPTYSSPFGAQQSYSAWNRPWSMAQMPYSGWGAPPLPQPQPLPNSSWFNNPLPNGSYHPLPNAPWFGGGTTAPAPFPAASYGQFQTPVTGFSPYVPSALQSDPTTWRTRLSDNGQQAYNEAMRQLRVSNLSPQAQAEQMNQIERDYETAQQEYNQAWNEYVGAKAFNLIPFLGDQDRDYIANMVGATVPGTQPVTDTPSDGTRAADRNLQLADRWAAVRQGLEWGNQLFGNPVDPDPRTQDRFEQSQQFLDKVADIGEQYGLKDTAHDFRRWQLQERASAYNNLRSAYAPLLDERVLALGDTLFNPSQAGSAPSPMAQQLGGRYTRPNAGGNTGRQSANWAYRNSSLM